MLESLAVCQDAAYASDRQRQGVLSVVRLAPPERRDSLRGAPGTRNLLYGINLNTVPAFEGPPTEVVP